MAKIDLTGIPELVAAESTATGQALASDIVTPQPLSATLPSLVRSLLDRFADDAVVIIDPNSRKVTGASGGDGGNLGDSIAEIAGVAYTSLVPDVGQSGRSLMFSKDADGIVRADIVAAINQQVDAVKPKKTVESLVASILSAEFNPGEPLPVIVVDQVNGKVGIYLAPNAGDTQAGVDSVPNAGDRVQIALSEPAIPADQQPSVFEGGAIA